MRVISLALAAPAVANLLDQIKDTPTAEQSEAMLAGLSAKEKKDLLLSLLDDKKPATEQQVKIENWFLLE